MFCICSLTETIVKILWKYPTEWWLLQETLIGLRQIKQDKTVTFRKEHFCIFGPSLQVKVWDYVVYKALQKTRLCLSRNPRTDHVIDILTHLLFFLGSLLSLREFCLVHLVLIIKGSLFIHKYGRNRHLFDLLKSCFSKGTGLSSPPRVNKIYRTQWTL